MRSAAEKVTEGLSETNGSLQAYSGVYDSGHLRVDCLSD